MKPFILRLKLKIMKIILATLLVGVVFVSCKEIVYKDKIYEKSEILREAPSDFLSPEESMETPQALVHAAEEPAALALLLFLASR